MKAYKQLDPQAHHSWRMWQGTVSGKAGITFDHDTCGDAMGEHDYKALNGEVKELKTQVKDQSKELQVVEVIAVSPSHLHFVQRAGDAGPLLGCKVELFQKHMHTTMRRSDGGRLTFCVCRAS